MSTGTTMYGYDPTRVDALRTRTIEAIDALDTIRCDDPLAADAIHAARLLRQNLEDAWMPLLDGITHSTAMVQWRRRADLDAVALVADIVDQHADDALARLRTGLTPITRWLASSGLEHLSAAQLTDQLGEAMDDLDETIRLGGDVPAAWDRLERLLAEAAGRLEQGDRNVAAHLAEHWHGDGLDDLIGTLDRWAWTVTSDRFHHIGIAADAHLHAERLTAELLGAAARAHPELNDAIVGHVASSPRLAWVLAADPSQFDQAVLIGAANELLAYVDGSGTWADRARVEDRHEALAGALVAVAADPATALELLAAEGTVEAVATNRHIAADAVEQVTAAALSAPASSAHHLHQATGLLSRLVALAAAGDGSTLAPGTRRAVALTWGVYAPLVTPTLDTRLDVAVVVPTGDGTAVVRLGSYDDLTRLMGEIVDDATAQLTLGLVVGALRADQLDRATEALRRRPHARGADAHAYIAAALADVSRMTALIERSVIWQDELHLFRHGRRLATSRAVVDVIVTGARFVPTTAPLASRFGSVTTRAIVAAIGPTGPRAVPDTGIDADLAIDLMAGVIAVPVRSPDLRAQLGVGSVPAATWDELETLLDDLDRPGDGDRDDAGRREVRARIRHLVDGDAELDTYLESIMAASGDSALGAPGRNPGRPTG